MQTDLHITDSQYLIALTVFFFPYSLFEVRPAHRTAEYSLTRMRVAAKQRRIEETETFSMALLHYAHLGYRHGTRATRNRFFSTGLNLGKLDTAWCRP